jgi:uncharacterized protein YjgD (DUF1641 family)
MEGNVSIQNGWASTEAGKQLQSRLNEERTVQAIDRLLDRIDTLEQAVDKLTTAMELGPGMVSMATDVVDESIRKAAEKGVDIEQRLGNALALAEKLTAPEMVEKLDGLLKAVDQAPGMISMTMDMVDEGYRNAAANGVDIEQRLSTALQLAEQLTAPAMVEKLEGLLTLADQAPGLIAMTVDMVDEEIAKANAKGIDINVLIETGAQLSEAIATSKELPEAKVGGIFSMLRTMRDPDRQRAIGYIMNIAKAWGMTMKK